MRWISVVCAYACALLMMGAPAAAQSPNGMPIIAPSGSVPVQAMTYDDGSGHALTISVVHGLPANMVCSVVSGDQAFTVGSAAGCTLTSSGRLRVGLSSAAQEGAAIASYSDLAGALGTDGFQHALRLDSNLNLKVTAKGDQRTFTLASNATLAASTCGTPVLIDISAQYGWVYQFSGTTTIALKYRGPDGSTYLTTSYSATATGSQFVPITAGATGTYIEVCNTGSALATSLYTALAN